jgi:hypothetical protein
MKTLTPSGNAEELLETPPYIFDETSDYANDPSRFAHKNVTVGNVPIEPPPPQPLLKNVQSRRAEKHLKSSAAVHPVTSLPSAQLPQPQSPKPPQQAQSQHSWFSPAPASLSDVIQALTNGWYGDNYKLVCGNSSYGVFPQWEWSGVSVLVDISRVPELSGINILPSAAGTATLPPGGTGSQAKAHSPPTIFPSGFLPPPLPLAPMFLCLGATSTIQALIDVLVQADEPSGNPYLKQASGMVQAMVKHLKRIAGYQVRNVGSIAGSLMMARLWNFPGDIYGIFAGVGATLQIWQRSTGTTTTMSLDEFQTLTGEFLLLSIQLPLWLDYEGENLWFGCARVAQRLQNSHPLVNGFFFCTFDNTEPSQAVSAYFGNITLANTPVNGPDQPLRPAMAASTSHYRLSRESALMVWQACYQAGWTGEYSLDNVMQTVLSELVSVASYPDTSAQGPIATRCDIAVNLLRKYCITHLGAPAPSGDPFGASIHQSLYDVRTAQPSRGSQSFMVNSSEEPVSEPMIKSSAIGQTSGLANYTHTLVPPDCLFGTFVTSWATAGKLTWLMNPTQAAEAVSAWYNQTYGGAFQPSQWQVWTGQDPSLAKINLMNAYFWTYAATPPSPSSYQNFPTYLLANVEVVYNGQPVAIITGPTERAVTLGAEWLGTQASQFFQVDVVTPILSISDAKSHQATQFSPYGTVMVDQNPNFIAATVFNTTNAVTSAPGHNPYHAINSVSKDPNGPNANTQIDFTQFDAETYDVFTGTHAVPAQMHMYMETQAAVAYPPTKTRPACAKQKKSKPHQPPSPTANSKDSDEDPLTAQQRARAASSKLIPPAAPVETQFMLMYASTQSCMSLQSQVTSMLNTIDPPGADQTWGVSLFTPQLGGGFGGKEVQSNSTSLAAAFAAWSTQKPVRFVLSRDADMKIIGHRHPFEGSFQVAVERATGRITAVQIDYAMDAGCTYDATLPIMDLALLASDNAYQFDYFCATGLAYFTNKASNTSFRSFGVVQAHQITEYILERVCERFPQFSPMQLRAVNFYPYQIASPFPRTPFGQEVKYANLDGVWTDIDSMMAGMSENKRFDAVSSESGVSELM